IVAVDGRPLGARDDLRNNLLRSEFQITANRNGQQIDLPAFTLETVDLAHKANFTDAAGFQLKNGAADPRTVDVVDPAADVAQVGQLQAGDVILKVNGEEMTDRRAVEKQPLVSRKTPLVVKPQLQLAVVRDGNEQILPPFTVQTIGLHPTQVY